MQNSVPYDTVCRGEDVNHIHMPSVPRLEDLPPAPAGKAGWPWDSQPPVFEENLPDGAHWPRISVVTPSYNQGAFIEETIRSVLLQGYPNLEYFIMDGGSTDNTVEVIRKYEPWLSGWVSEKDRGQAHAVNKGWSRSSGPILGWLNSDDLYAPQALHAAARAWRCSGQPRMVYGDALSVDVDLRPRGQKKVQDYSLSTMLLGRCMAQPAVFISADLFADIGPLDESLWYALDFEYFLRAWLQPEATSFCHVPQVLAYSRTHPATKCATGGRCHVQENINVLRNMWHGRMQACHLSREWRGVFARALMRQAGKAARLRAIRLMWSVCTEAWRWSPHAAVCSIPRIVTQTVGPGQQGRWL